MINQSKIVGDLIKDGGFTIPLTSHDILSEALNLAIKIIRKSSGNWKDHVLRKYRFQIFPHDSAYGPPSFNASLMVTQKEGKMPWEKGDKLMAVEEIDKLYDIPDEDIDKRILLPSPTRKAFLEGFRYSLWADIRERWHYWRFHLRWCLKWNLARIRYRDQLLGFMDGKVLLKERQS